MTTYNTYAEAKIANQGSTIFEMQDGTFQTKENITINNFGSQTFKQCNIDDYCVGARVYLDSKGSHEDIELLINSFGKVFTKNEASSINLDTLYILKMRAAALEHKDNIPSLHESHPNDGLIGGIKPKRTKVEYVKCDLGLFQLGSLFIAGSLFYRINDKYFEFDNQYEIAEKFINENIYRKVETEIDERQEFIDAYAWATQDDKHNIEDIAGMLYDSGKFKLVEV